MADSGALAMPTRSSWQRRQGSYSNETARRKMDLPALLMTFFSIVGLLCGVGLLGLGLAEIPSDGKVFMVRSAAFPENHVVVYQGQQPTTSPPEPRYDLTLLGVHRKAIWTALTQVVTFASLLLLSWRTRGIMVNPDKLFALSRELKWVGTSLCLGIIASIFLSVCSTYDSIVSFRFLTKNGPNSCVVLFDDARHCQCGHALVGPAPYPDACVDLIIRVRSFNSAIATLSVVIVVLDCLAIAFTLLFLCTARASHRAHFGASVMWRGSLPRNAFSSRVRRESLEAPDDHMMLYSDPLRNSI